jgi:hypothetical protein
MEAACRVAAVGPVLSAVVHASFFAVPAGEPDGPAISTTATVAASSARRSPLPSGPSPPLKLQVPAPPQPCGELSTTASSSSCGPAPQRLLMPCTGSMGDGRCPNPLAPELMPEALGDPLQPSQTAPEGPLPRRLQVGASQRRAPDPAPLSPPLPAAGSAPGGHPAGRAAAGGWWRQRLALVPAAASETATAPVTYDRARVGFRHQRWRRPRKRGAGACSPPRPRPSAPSVLRPGHCAASRLRDWTTCARGIHSPMDRCRNWTRATQRARRSPGSPASSPGAPHASRTDRHRHRRRCGLAVRRRRLSCQQCRHHCRTRCCWSRPLQVRAAYASLAAAVAARQRSRAPRWHWRRRCCHYWCRAPPNVSSAPQRSAPR